MRNGQCRKEDCGNVPDYLPGQSSERVEKQPNGCCDTDNAQSGQATREPCPRWLPRLHEFLQSRIVLKHSSLITHQSSIINHILGFTAPPKLSTGLNLSGPTFLPRVAFYSLGLVELTLGSCCNAFGVTNPIARLNQIVKHAKPSLRLVKTLYWNRSTSSLDRR
jgi:hypothetical protein